MIALKKYLYSIATDNKKGLLAAFLKAILFCLSILYGLLVRITHFLYKTSLLKKKLPKPVISIGNITLGGSGKTPLVALIVEHVKGLGLKPAILTRGYMADKSSSEGASDEVALLSESIPDVPIVVGKNRYKSGKQALAKGNIDVFILDDGFQHWGLKRDIDIVLVDSTQPFGNGKIIPRGILREPLSSLSRADMFVITRADLGKDNVAKIHAKLSELKYGIPVVEAIHRPVMMHNIVKTGESASVVILREKNVCSFCSIGNPDAFKQTLVRLGANVIENFDFLDHYCYTEKDILKVIDYCKLRNIDTIVTTQKDAVKIQRLIDSLSCAIDIYSLEVTMELLSGKEKFLDRVSSLLNR